MKLIAQKPCSFGGKKFYIGDEIPAEYVVDPKAQAKMGVLAIVADDAVFSPAETEEESVKPETVEVVVHVEEGDMPLNLTTEGLQAFVDVITGKATDAEAIIEGMTDCDALILLHVSDNRKSVKAAAEARAKALSAEESEGEQ